MHVLANFESRSDLAVDGNRAEVVLSTEEAFQKKIA